MRSCCYCCHTALRDALRGISLLIALGGLATALLGVHALLPLGATATDVGVAWFAWLLVAWGAALLLVGLSASVGCLAAPLHCLTGATLALLPLEALLVWTYCEHPSQLARIGAFDQTYTLTAILSWVGTHKEVAAGLVGVWMLLQGAAVLLGAIYACCPSGRPQRHPWDRYWDDEAREHLLLWNRGDPNASPRAAGYHTPPSRFASPYASPQRPQTWPPAPPLPAPPAAPLQVA